VKRRSIETLRVGTTILLLILCPTSGHAEPIENSGRLVEELETEETVGGEDDALDAQGAQGREAEGTGGEVEGLPRRAAQRVENIVVTARRRAEFLEDTPVAVTALNENLLREADVTRLDQINTLVPNLTFLRGRSGNDATVFIRGIGQAQSQVITFDPGVGIYVDGVYLARSQGSVIDVLDVQQIEVLRGPQGTLFGKNTVGGAINITTVKPGDELEAFASVRAGSRDTVQTRASLNVPIDIGWFEDKLFTRVALGSSNTRGYTYNALRDEWWSDENSLNFLGSVRFVPTEDLTFDVTGSWSRNHNNGKGGECVFIEQTPVLIGLWPSPNRENFEADCNRSQPYHFESNVDGINDVESYGTWGTGTWDIGEAGWFNGLQLKLLSSWREQIPRLREDFDMTQQRVGQYSTAGGSGEFTGEPGFAQQISEELQMTGTALDDELSFVGGVYGFWEDANQNASVRAFPGPITPGPSQVGDITSATTNQITKVSNWSWALFTQLTYDFFEWASLTGGVRYTREKKGLDLNLARPVLPPGYPGGCVDGGPPECVPALPLVDVDESELFGATTPMASLALRAPEELLEPAPIEHLMGYFTYSRGFKSGGFNGMAREQGTDELSAFQPEFLDSYEVGIKTISLENRLTFNVAIFKGNYTDQQVQSVVLGPPLIPGGPPQVSLAVTNAAASKTQGLEIEAVALPIDGLTVQGNVGLLDSQFINYLAPSDLDASTVSRAGQRFPFVPEVQTHLAVQYSFPIEFEGPEWLQGWLTPRLDWYYQGSVRYAGPELPQATQSGYNLLNVRLSYDFLDDRAQFAFWGLNMLDTEYFEQVTGSASSFGDIVRFYEAPLTAGVEMSYRY